MKKKIFAVIIAALMVAVMFPLTAFAEVNDGHATSVKLAETEEKAVTLDSSNPYYVNGTDGAIGTVSSTEPASWNAYFNAATGELTLDGLNLKNTGSLAETKGVLFAQGNLKIILEQGTESAVSTEDEDTCGMTVKWGKLEITGKGTLNVTAPARYYAIVVEKYKSGSSDYTEDDLKADNSFTIDGSTVNVRGCIYDFYDRLTLKNGAKLNVEEGTIDANEVIIDGGDMIFNNTKFGVFIIDVREEFKIVKGNLIIDNHGDAFGIKAKKISLNGGSVKINCLSAAFSIAPTFGSGYTYIWRTAKEGSLAKTPFEFNRNNGYAEIISGPEVTYPNGSSFEKGKAPAGFGVSLDMDEEDFNADNNFEAAQISSDGETFTPLTQDKEFEVINGSILIKLKEDYLNTLAVGEYTLRVYLSGTDFEYTDAAGSAGPVHDIISAITQSTEENPNTGAETALSAAVALAVISGAALLLKKKK